MRAALIFGLAAAALSAGCSVFAPVRIETTSYVLDKLPTGLQATTAGPSVISVPLPETAPLYATRRMAYSTEPHQIGHFNESEWALPPAQMIHPLLVVTLRRTGRFAAVEAIAPLRGSFVLRTEVLEVLQDFTAQPALFRLRLRVSLERGTDHGIAATRELSATEPLRENTARAGVAAGNEAMEKLLRDVAAFAVENTPPSAR
jgi:cholesterol transport system auxiliary component